MALLLRPEINLQSRLEQMIVKAPQNWLVIRNTLNWDNAVYADLWNDKIRHAARCWDSVFRVKYMTCRARIKQIAGEMQQEISKVRVVTGPKARETEFGTSDLVLIADDDDWYHPAVFDLLRAADATEYDIVLWPDGFHGLFVPRCPESAESTQIERYIDRFKIRPLDDPTAFGPVKTNNYAITGNLLERLPLMSVMRHGPTGKLISKDPSIRVKKVQHTLSLVNRHPCSYTVLTYFLANQPPADALLDFVAGYVQTPKLPQDKSMAWAFPGLRAMRDLFKSVLASAF